MERQMSEERQKIPLTIFLEPELKQKMDAVPVQVDWEAVGRRAIVHQVDVLAFFSTRRRTTTQEIAARLRASRKGDNEVLSREGERDGRRWAADLAGVHSLERLEHFREEHGPEWRGLFEGCSSRTEPAERLAYLIATNEDHAYYATGGFLTGFWDDIAGQPVPDTAAYVRGFAEGALAVWLVVKPHVIE